MPAFVVLSSEQQNGPEGPLCEGIRGRWFALGIGSAGAAPLPRRG
jgi:hypothetical protein